MPQSVFMALVTLIVIAAAAGVLVYVVLSVQPRTRAWLLLGTPLAARAAWRWWSTRAERARVRRGKHAGSKADRDAYDMQWTSAQPREAVAVKRAPAWATEPGYQAQQRARWEAREIAVNGGAPLVVIPAPYDQQPSTVLQLRALDPGELERLEDDVRRVLADPTPAVVLEATCELFAGGKPGLREIYGPAHDELPEPEEAWVQLLAERAPIAEHAGATADWSPSAEVAAAGRSLEDWLSQRLQQYTEALKAIDHCPRWPDGRGAYVVAGTSLGDDLDAFVDGSQQLHAYRMLRIGGTGELPLVRDAELVAA